MVPIFAGEPWRTASRRQVLHSRDAVMSPGDALGDFAVSFRIRSGHLNAWRVAREQLSAGAHGCPDGPGIPSWRGRRTNALNTCATTCPLGSGATLTRMASSPGPFKNGGALVSRDSAAAGRTPRRFLGNSRASFRRCEADRERDGPRAGLFQKGSCSSSAGQVAATIEITGHPGLHRPRRPDRRSRVRGVDR